MPDSTTRETRLYTDLSGWWPLLSHPDDYAEEAAAYADALEQTCDGPIASLLELGSGGGNNAFHLKRRFDQLVLTDISPGMLDVSRALIPDCEHHLGDMRTLRLDRTFDAVFVHDAVCYMTTERELLDALETAWVHCRPGGRRPVRPRLRSRAVPTRFGRGWPRRGIARGTRRLPARLALSGVGVGSGSERLTVRGRLRLSPARARRLGLRRARSPPRRAVLPGSLAGPHGPSGVRATQRAGYSHRLETRCHRGVRRTTTPLKRHRRSDRPGKARKNGPPALPRSRRSPATHDWEPRP